jgi:hypothetical protein
MSASFEITLDAGELVRFQAAMGRLEAAGRDLGPAMRGVAETLNDGTGRRFAAAGPALPPVRRVRPVSRGGAGGHGRGAGLSGEGAGVAASFPCRG